jgi:glycosyltransferase involved in cell wall biosynthesis
MLGGAETSSAALALAMRAAGVDARIVFVMTGEPLSQRLDETRVPYSSVGLGRGRDVLRHPHRLARLVSKEADVVISMSAGYLAGALRAGGFRGPIVAVEHGALLQMRQLSHWYRTVRRIDRYSGVWACAAEVAVSEYLAARLRTTHHARPLAVIPNGVDLDHYRPATSQSAATDGVVVGCAARLIPGKGIDDAIRAFSRPELHGSRLRIAGQGPAGRELEALAGSLPASTRIQFVGSVQDMASFWRECDIALVPSNTFVESFGMAAIEAMACGKPVVVSTSGALPEVVHDGVTGRVYEAGDVTSLALAIAAYQLDPELRHRHGVSARRRCEERFAITDVARRYLALAGVVSDGS